jgi:hypothetical protein
MPPPAWNALIEVMGPRIAVAELASAILGSPCETQYRTRTDFEDVILRTRHQHGVRGAEVES